MLLSIYNNIVNVIKYIKYSFKLIILKFIYKIVKYLLGYLVRD